MSLYYKGQKVSPIIGMTPVGSIDITQNGEYDVTNYAKANVNIQAVAEDPIYYEVPYSCAWDHGDNYIEYYEFTFLRDNLVNVRVTFTDLEEPDLMQGVYSITDNILTVNLDESTIVFEIISKNQLNGQNDFSPLILIANATIPLNISENGSYKASDYLMHGFSEVNVNVSDMLQARVDETNSCEYLLYHYLGNNPNIVKNLNTDNVTTMSYMFSGCTSLTSLDVSGFNTSNVTNMSNMFNNCESLTSLDLSNFNTSNVTDMGYMFYKCGATKNIDLSNFDTSKTSYLSWIFAYITDANVNASGWNISSAGQAWDCFAYSSGKFNLSNWIFPDYIGSMFRSSLLTSVGPSDQYDINSTGWDFSKTSSINGMFSTAKSLVNVNLDNLNTSKLTSCVDLFYRCTELTSISLNNWDVSNVTSLQRCFNDCNKVTSLSLSGWNPNKLTNLGQTFYRMYAITSINIENWDTSNVTNMRQLFYDDEKLVSVIGTLDCLNNTDFSNMFYDCIELVNINLKNIKSNIQLGSSTRYGTKLSNDSLIQTIKELWDYSSDSTTYTLTLSTTSKENLANVYVKLITPTVEQIEADPNIVNKMPCEVCDSSDPDAMLITEYAILKKWSIA